jgi:hypothetical protein
VYEAVTGSVVGEHAIEKPAGGCPQSISVEPGETVKIYSLPSETQYLDFLGFYGQWNGRGAKPTPATTSAVSGHPSWQSSSGPVQLDYHGSTDAPSLALMHDYLAFEAARRHHPGGARIPDLWNWVSKPLRLALSPDREQVISGPVRVSAEISFIGAGAGTIDACIDETARRIVNPDGTPSGELRVRHAERVRVRQQDGRFIVVGLDIPPTGIC